MRIFTKKCFEFDFGGKKIVTVPLGYTDGVPDDAEKNAFFALALKAGDAVVFGNAAKPEAKPEAKPKAPRGKKTDEKTGEPAETPSEG